jgi:hypothetical protein
MKVDLSSLTRCFQGLIPSTIATCSKSGEPNITFLSQVYYLDSEHVALSCQFFNKTRKNVEENPFACVEVYDPKTLDAYRLHVRYERSETSGPTFDAMALRIQAIASMTGMEGIFRLLSADIYRVLRIQPVTSQFVPAAPAAEKGEASTQAPYLQVKGVQLISCQINRASSLDDLFNGVLASIDEMFGFRHAMILLPDESGRRLVALASRGYGEGGIGAEVAFGEGFIGAVAEQRRALRISHVPTDLRYARAIRQRIQSSEGAGALRPEVLLPGLPDAQSQLALPLLVQDRLVGVLALESRAAMTFDEWDEALLNILANQIAVGIDTLGSREEEEAPAPSPAPPSPKPAKKSGRRTFTLFRSDDCIFVDGEYLVRNVPGLILWKLLNAYQKEGQLEFSNRELRLDGSLKLPEVRDNLESRLILLRKRLLEQCPDVALVPVRRGRFALEVKCALELVEKP